MDNQDTLQSTIVIGIGLVYSIVMLYRNKKRRDDIDKAMFYCKLGNKKGLEEMIGVDLSYTNDIGWNPLIIASKEGKIEIVRYLIEERKVTINPLKRNGLILHTPCRAAALYGHLDVVRYLVEVGKADINLASLGNRTPLHGAAMNGHIDVVKYLIKQGADASQVNDFGETAYDIAVKGGHTEIATITQEAIASAKIT